MDSERQEHQESQQKHWKSINTTSTQRIKALVLDSWKYR